MQEPVSDIIARANAKGKVVDFRNNLVLAKPEHYAMMQGCGGKDYAANSTIRIAVCDYSNGTGEGNSVTVAANLPPEIFPIMLEVCRKNIGETKSVWSEGIWKTLGLCIDKQKQILNALLGLTHKSMMICAGICREKIPVGGKSLAEEIGRALKETKALFAEESETEPFFSVPFTCDFSRKQERVNIYKRDGSGFVPVSVLWIFRSGYRKNGEAGRMPWTIKITNFWAKPVEQPNGTTSYDGKTVRDSSEAFIMLSDEDMFRCCYRVIRFMEVWENARCIPLVAAGIALREKQRMERGKENA